MGLAYRGVKWDMNVKRVIKSAKTDTLVKTVLENVLLTVTAVIKNRDFVILDVIRDGKGQIVQKSVMITVLVRIAASNVDIVSIIHRVIT